jgi:hypothetical protein
MASILSKLVTWGGILVPQYFPTTPPWIVYYDKASILSKLVTWGGILVPQYFPTTPP